MSKTAAAGRIGGSNRVLSMREAADYLGVSYKRFAASYKGWSIACHRIGGRVKFRERDLEWFLDRTRETP
jgi:excisionase family DNA binding protein